MQVIQQGQSSAACNLFNLNLHLELIRSWNESDHFVASSGIGLIDIVLEEPLSDPSVNRLLRKPKWNLVSVPFLKRCFGDDVVDEDIESKENIEDILLKLDLFVSWSKIVGSGVMFRIRNPGLIYFSFFTVTFY